MDSFNFTLFLPYISVIVGIGIIVVAALSKSGTERLAKTGERCDGIIFKLGYKDDNASNRTDSITKDKITVRFVTKNRNG